jgi:hypothetical protein
MANNQGHWRADQEERHRNLATEFNVTLVVCHAKIAGHVGQVRRH